jgi:hypothetical protein
MVVDRDRALRRRDDDRGREQQGGTQRVRRGRPSALGQGKGS